jgi:excisionase family DNA binding protein
MDLLDSKEAAAFLRVSQGTLSMLRKKHKLPFVQIGRRVMFRRDSLVEFINSRTTTQGE